MGPIAHAVCYLRLYTGEWSSPMWALTRVQARAFSSHSRRTLTEGFLVSSL